MPANDRDSRREAVDDAPADAHASPAGPGAAPTGSVPSVDPVTFDGAGHETGSGGADEMPLALDFGYPLVERLSDELAEHQRDVVPPAFHGHPEMGRRAASDPEESFELIHLRTPNARVLYTPSTGNAVALVGQAPVHAVVGDHLVSSMPAFVADAKGVRVDSPHWRARLERWEEGIVIDGPWASGTIFHVLREANLATVDRGGSRREIALPDPVFAAVDHRSVAASGRDLDLVLRASIPGLAYELEIDAAWIARHVRAATERVELSQRWPLPEGWEVRVQNLDVAISVGNGWVETCAPIVAGLPGETSLRISPPSLLDQKSPWAPMSIRPLGVGCGEATTHRVRVRDRVLELVAVLDGAWLRDPARAFPIVFDPLWEFERQQRLGSGIPPGATWGTLVGALDMLNNVNLPTAAQFASGLFGFRSNGWNFTEYVADFPGQHGATGHLWSRSHFDLTGLAIFAASVEGGENPPAEFYPVSVTTAYLSGPWVRASAGYGTPSACQVTIDSATRAQHWQTRYTYQDGRCVNGTSAACVFSNVRSGFQNPPSVRRDTTTNFTSPAPFAGWASPVRGAGTLAEAATCGGDAGNTFGAACRAFAPGIDQTVVLDGQLTSGDVDHFGFFLDTPRSPIFDVVLTNDTGGCRFDGVVELWGNINGTTQMIRSYDDQFVEGTGEVELCPRFTTASFPSGAYSLAVSGFTNADVGAYRLIVTVRDGGDRRVPEYRFGAGTFNVSPTLDLMGPDATESLYLSLAYAHDYGGFARTDGTCNGWDVQRVGNPINRFGVVPFARIQYIGRVTQSPTNLAARPLSRSECASRGQAEGCGLEWSWSPAPKARWYNLLEGVGRIEDVRALLYGEVGLGENTRHARRIEGANEFAPGPPSPQAARGTTMVRTPTLADLAVSEPAPGAVRVTATAPPGFTGVSAPCGGDANCTAVRYQARRCLPAPVTCIADGACGTVAGQPGVCRESQCMAESSWLSSTTWDVSTDGHACWEFRIRYRNQDGVQGEGWSPWVRETFVNLVPPALLAPTCADMADGAVRFRVLDQSIGEEGFRLYESPTAPLAFATLTSTSSSTTGTIYERVIPRALAAGNASVTALARAFATSGGVLYESGSSSMITAHTLHRAPVSSELRVDRVQSRAVELTLVAAASQPCTGRTGARIERCDVATGTCGVRSDFGLSAPFSGCDGRGYGSLWEHEGGRVAGVGDGQLFDSGLQPSTEYEYRVWYYNADGCESSSYLARRVTTLPEGPCCFDPTNPSRLDSPRCDGVCGGGTIVCNGSTLATCFCSAPPGFGVEVCDGLDNDCDGTVDDLQRAAANQVGACAGNVERCLAGSWSAAPWNHVPRTEICNGIDDDCNGQTDEGPGGQPLREVCYDGPAGTLNVGTCRSGERMCEAGRWGGCSGQVLPQPEVCNRLDDNCNGRVDEALANRFCLGGGDECDGPSPVPPAEPRACVEGCRIGTSICDNGELFCDVSGAGGPVLLAATEIVRVEQGPALDLTRCANAYTAVSCGATTMVTIDVMNIGQIPVGANTQVEFVLDRGEAGEARVAGPFPLGRVIGVDGSARASFCWLQDTTVRASEGRSLTATVRHPDDPASCLPPDAHAPRRPIALVGPSPEVCDGIDNDCDGRGDREQSAVACGNSVGDSTQTCRERMGGAWFCAAE